MKVWKLQSVSPEIGSIYITSEQEALQYTDLFSIHFYSSKAIRNNWLETLIYNLPVSDFSKFIFSGRVFWICSEKAKQRISPLLQKNVELLPLLHRKQANRKISYTKQLFRKKIYKPILEMIPNEPHYMLNISALKSLDVIDAEQSELKYDNENKTIYKVEKIVFKPNEIIDTHLFKIDNPNVYFQSTIFISDKLKEVIENNHLTGLNFIERPECEGGTLVWESDL